MLGLGGFLVLGLIIGCLYDKVVKITPLFVILYGLIAAVGNAGPGNLCGLTSSEVYPSAVRGTFYGISAAIGKKQALQWEYNFFTPIQQHLGKKKIKKWVFIISALLGLIGVGLVYFFIPETTKFDLAEQDKRWLEYLVENGWEGELGDESEGILGVKQALGRVKDSEVRGESNVEGGLSSGGSSVGEKH